MMKKNIFWSFGYNITFENDEYAVIVEQKVTTYRFRYTGKLTSRKKIIQQFMRTVYSKVREINI